MIPDRVASGLMGGAEKLMQLVGRLGITGVAGVVGTAYVVVTVTKNLATAR